MSSLATHHSKLSRSSISLAIALASFAGFIALARSVVPGAPGGLDLALERWSATHSSAVLHGFFLAISNIGGTTGMRILGFAGAVFLWLRSRRRLAVGMALVTLAAMKLFEISKAWIARPRPAHGSSIDPTYSFPSGHATLSAAVCVTLAYALWREDLAPGVAMLLSGIVIPFVIGISRIYLDMHYATDVLGGWLAGLALACTAVALYESTTHIHDAS